MKTTHIFSTFPLFSIFLACLLMLSACDRGDEYGTKTGEEGEQPEAYGLQDEIEGEQSNDKAEAQNRGGEYPADDNPRGDVVAGEDNEAREVEYGEAEEEYSEAEAQYPAEKIEEETKLNSNDPLELDSEFMSIERKKLLATLNRRKNFVEYYINDLENTPGNSEDSSTLAGNVEQLKLYREKLDLEMAKVRAVEEENFAEVAETAQAAMKGAGALMQSDRQREQRGY